MNAKAASILLNPHPCGHIVYPYTDQNLVGQAVALFASAGLCQGDGVVLIVSDDHREAIKVRLQLEGISAEDYERSGQLVCVTAEDLLAKFTRWGALEEGVFRSTIAALINQAKAGITTGYPGKVRVFGEMVSQLRGTDLKATARLEELWNEVILEHSVSLLCTYALNGASDHIPQVLLDLHSQRLPGELALP